MNRSVASSGESQSRVISKDFSRADPCHRAWIEVDPAAIEFNTRKLKELVSSNCLLMAVVKADGYGHGAETVARAAIRGGASYLGVATLQEGIDLRLCGIELPILILGNLINNQELNACVYWDLIPTVSSEREALLCEQVAIDNQKKFNLHLKIDTGMTRLGCGLQEAKKLLNIILNSRYLEIKGIYSHLAVADIFDQSSLGKITDLQLERFKKMINYLPTIHNECLIHLANSAGTLRSQDLHFDMVRVGLALYGYSPIANLSNSLCLQPALSVKARVTFIREVAKGVGVSYGHQFITNRDSRLAVVGIGYADGVNRALSGKISALINGALLPQVGAITMDQMILDVTDAPEVEIGSVVTLLGKEFNQCIPPSAWAELIGSISWEILCGFKNRLPRVVI